MKLSQIIMKKRILFLFLVSGLVFVLTGCPYQSGVPISSPSVSINKTLIGKWKKSKYKISRPQNYIWIRPNGSKQYRIIQYNYSSSKKRYKTKNFDAHLSVVNGKTYLNVKTPRRKYALYRLISANSRQFSVEPVTSNIDEKFRSSSQLQAFVAKHGHLSFFYEKKQTYYRK